MRKSSGGELHVIGAGALLRLLSQSRSDRERFLSLLRSRPFLAHADAIAALWGEHGDGGPLYAQHILAIYVARLRRAGHAIENHRGMGYRIQQPAGGMAEQTWPGLRNWAAAVHGTSRAADLLKERKTPGASIGAPSATGSTSIPEKEVRGRYVEPGMRLTAAAGCFGPRNL